MKAYWESLRQMERSAWLYMVGWAVIAFGYFGIQAVLLNLYLLQLGFDSTYIGAFLAAGQLIWAVCGLPAGVIGARFGVRGALTAGYLLVILGWAALLLAEALPPASLNTGLMAGWMLSWVGASFITVNSLPYLMSVTTVDNRGYVFSFQQAIQAVFALLGGIAAGALPSVLVASVGSTNLTEAASYRIVLGLLPLSHLIGLAAMLRARPVTLRSADSSGAVRAGAPLGLFAFYALIVLLQAAGEGGVRAFFNLYLHQSVSMSTEQIGTLYGLAQLSPMAAAVIIPMMLRRMSSGAALGLSTLVLSAAILVLTLSHTVLSAAPGLVAFLLISAILATTRSMFSQEIVAEHWRPMTSALNTIFMALGWAGSAAIGGQAIAQVGYHGLFRAAAVLVALAGLITFVYIRAGARSEQSRRSLPTVPVTGEKTAPDELPAAADCSNSADGPTVVEI